MKVNHMKKGVIIGGFLGLTTMRNINRVSAQCLSHHFTR